MENFRNDSPQEDAFILQKIYSELGYTYIANSVKFAFDQRLIKEYSSIAEGLVIGTRRTDLLEQMQFSGLAY